MHRDISQKVKLHLPSAYETASLLAVRWLLVQALQKKHVLRALWSHLMFACSSLVTIESASYPSLFTSVAVLLVFWLFLCLVTPEAKGKETNIY